MNSRRIQSVFFGTPELSVYVLEELHTAGILPSLIVTAPDRPVGRKLISTPSPVSVWAAEHGIAILKSDTVKSPEYVAELANSEWDVGIVAAYNIILPSWLLMLPRRGVLNVHPSMLPLNRGPSPIRSAIFNDNPDAVGVSIILLDEKMDHGPLLAQARVELSEWPVRGTMLDEILFREGGRLLIEVLPKWLEGTLTPVAQEHEKATFTKKIKKADGEIHLDGDGYQNYLRFCAYDGWPGVYFYTERGNRKMRVKVANAVFKNGVFIPIRVIPEGKKEMDFEDWQRNG